MVRFIRVCVYSLLGLLAWTTLVILAAFAASKGGFGVLADWILGGGVAVATVGVVLGAMIAFRGPQRSDSHPPVRDIPDLRVLRQGAIVHRGTLAEIVSLAEAGTLSAIDEIDGLGPHGPVDLYAVPEIARALAIKERYLLWRNVRAYALASVIFVPLMILFVVSAVTKGDADWGFVVLAVIFAASFVWPMVPIIKRRTHIRTLLDIDRPADVGAARDERLFAFHLNRAPWATIGLVALLFLVLLANGGGLTEWSLLHFGKINDRVRAGEIWRLVTATLLHAGVLHFVFNAAAIVSSGIQAENLLGPRSMVLTFFGTGAAGSIASTLFEPRPSVGASGAIFGLFGACLAIGVRYRRRLPPQVRKSLTVSIALTIAINVALGWFVPDIDDACHLGGLLAGIALGSVLRLDAATEALLRPRPSPPRRHPASA